MAVAATETLYEDEEFLEDEDEDEVPLDQTSQEFVDDLVDKVIIFMNELVGFELFPYQIEFARRLVESVVINDGEEVTALFSRQSGKSETVADVVAALMILLPRLAVMYPDLLGKFKRGFWVGLFAPTDDQVETLFSRIVTRLTSERATEMLLDPELDDLAEGKGKKVALKKSGSFCRMQTANPRAKIESKSYHLIIVDEAQDTDDYVVRKSIHPMGAFYNATLCKTGTPTTRKGDFYKAIQHNKRRHTRRGSRRNHFEADWKYCNTPEAPIWMGDFSFKPLGEVQVGDEVVGWAVAETTLPYDRRGAGRGFTRTKRTRRLTKATVLAVHRRQALVVKVTMASGKVIRCTGDHQWLSGKSKGATAVAERIQGGIDYFITPDVGRSLVKVIEPTPVLDPSLSWTAAWLGGLWDGEGTTHRIAQSQEHNPDVYKAIGQALTDLGFTYSTDPMRHYILGGRQSLVNFLNWTQPVRRSNPWVARDILRTKFMAETDEIVSIEPDGVDEVISMTTTTGNYVAWGYASKNCAKYNPNYAKYVRKEMRRLGEDSDEFQLAYALKWLLERGMFVTSETMESLGDKSMEIVRAWWKTPVLVGIDPARTLDSTVVTVVWVDWDRPDEFGFYDHRILNWLELHGDQWEEQYGQIMDFLANYNVLAGAVDAQGVGDAVADRLARLMPRTEWHALQSDRSAQSERWKHLKQLVERGMIGWPAHAKTRRLKVWQRFRQQMIDVEKKYEGAHLLVAAPDEPEAHDDYVDSLALACCLTAGLSMPEVEVSQAPFYETRRERYAGSR